MIMLLHHPPRLLTSARRHSLVIIAGVSLRLLLFHFTSLSEKLEQRPELTTPLTSFRSLKEGVFIHEKGSNPYDGGVFYHSPLYLLFFTYLAPITSFFLIETLWILADVYGALALTEIWKTRVARSGIAKGKENRDALVSLLYLFNPYTLLTCLARSTTSLDNAVLLLAISSAAQGHVLSTCVAIAVAVHTSLYPIIIVPPLVMLLSATTTNRGLTGAALYLVLFTAFSAAFACLNWLVLGPGWTARSWGTMLTVSDLTPNVGMWWYFFTEMFDHFRAFYLGVFQLQTVIYTAPVCLRLRSEPLAAILVLVGVISTWKSYPTLGDMVVWPGLLACFPDLVSNLRHPLFTLAVHLYACILLPLLHSLWLVEGTGNANFFYAATMVYGLNSSLAVIDVLGSWLRVQVTRDVSTRILIGTTTPPGWWDRDKASSLWEQRGWTVTQLASLSHEFAS